MQYKRLIKWSFLMSIEQDSDQSECDFQNEYDSDL